METHLRSWVSSKLLRRARVPPADVEETFGMLTALIRQQYSAIAYDLLSYFQDNYVGQLRVNGPRRRPTFQIALCNMFHHIYVELPRTNNATEGQHHTFLLLVIAHHCLSSYVLEIFRYFTALGRKSQDFAKLSRAPSASIVERIP